jgi:hypothetical protein
MTVIEEHLTAKGFTPAAHVPLVYGRKRTIDAITIHWWGLFGQTHDGVNNFFVNGVGATSCHFVASGVPRPRITCLVSPLDAAWHAGNAVGNATTVGIECRPEATEADYKVIAELVRWIRDVYGANLPLIPHRDWQATQCPGHWDLGKIHRMAEALKTKPIVKQPVPAPKPVAPKKPVGGIVDIKYDRDIVKPTTAVQLRKDSAWTLKNSDMKTNWNLADEGLGLGYYDIDLFLQGIELPDGESITVNAFIVTGTGTGRNRSGYFSQEIHGSTNGSFHSSVRLKTPLLSTAAIEVDVTASSDCKLKVWGSDIFKFQK